MQPTILYENSDLLVINKPAGLVVHGDGKHIEPTVMDWFLNRYPESKDVGEPMEIEFEGETIPVERSGIVHRIDRDTSGCLLLAKNQESFLHLKQQFQDHIIKKKYIAVVYGWVKYDRGIIDEPLGRSSSNIRAWTTKRGARGVLRPAITRYVVKKRFEHQGEKYSIVDLYPQTGRTHQLRVHMLHLGHAMVADPLYASSKTSSLAITRTALHAERISLRDRDDKELEISAPLPEDLAKIVLM